MVRLSPITFPGLILVLSLISSTYSRAVSNTTLGARGSSFSGAYQTCVSVSGNWLGFAYNFGCLCSEDIDSFCSNNNIDSSFKSVLKSYVSSKGSSKFYPTNSQPTCDGNGGYHCGSLSITSKGCGTSTCEVGKYSTNGGCCPRGQTYRNGKCCGSVGCNFGQEKCTPTLICKTYSSNGVCCPSGTSGYTGYSTVCCPKGQIENGSTGKCISQCPSGQEYNSAKGKCEATCDTSNGYTYQTTYKGSGICCKKSHKACSTVCCPVDKPEVGSTGVCCPTGSVVANGVCTSPSGATTTTAWHNRRFFAEQVQLKAAAFVASYGMPENSAGVLCPKGLAACPIPGAALDQYECLDSTSELQSCGGCASLGSGQDCTALPGARWMGCNSGACEVYSCKPGWARALNGTVCERL
ncbi:hypothetical protein L198_05771 [Cryptococcus wingfieldii CBS 7118]|uniref:Protein CPL1-like domain-containing protein n=1 Tax=Cryptococcus wingfieldii CBS 7118 TaxID=1295528 RepID=A0A1E3IU27_9TREE|nr:hypothetical protein L198_05771 [Cryptococcus wingfieldii CBS 7118]ODN92099.1 hypothetical protein L198_05771 [Cryptococcus wingfieldii CBS 7118]